MKYTEFERLNSILENKGTSLNNFVKTAVGKNLFEADSTETLDTTSGNIITRAGRARNKLNDNAKKIQTALMDNLYKKYYAPVLANKKKIIDEANNLKNDNKTIEEIKTQLKGNIQVALNAQASQLSVLDKAADKILMNYTKKIDNIIQQSKMTDNNKLSLSNYWVMLTSQLKLNLYKYVQKQELKFIENTLSGVNDEAYADEMESFITDSAAFEEKLKNQETDVNAKKAEAKKSVQSEDKETTDETPNKETTDETPDEKTDDEESTDETPDETPDETKVVDGESEEMKPTEKEPEAVDAEEVENTGGIVDNEGKPILPDNSYEYTDKAGNNHVIEIISSDENELKFKKDGKEKLLVAPKELVNKMKIKKALPEAKPVKKRVIPLGGQEDTSNKKPIVAQEKTASTQTAEARAQKKAERLSQKKTKPGTGSKKIITKNK